MAAQPMNLYLIGYRGSGKSTVGPLVATMLDWPYVDTDREIENLAGQSIREIFERDGQAVFREWERTVIQAVATRCQAVISLGGGAILDPTNCQALKTTGWTVWLDAPAGLLHERIQLDPQSPETRPRLSQHDGLAEVQQGLQQRCKLYAACADYTVKIHQLPPREIAELIVKRWQSVDIHS